MALESTPFTTTTTRHSNLTGFTTNLMIGDLVSYYLPDQQHAYEFHGHLI